MVNYKVNAKREGGRKVRHANWHKIMRDVKAKIRLNPTAIFFYLIFLKQRNWKKNI